jgi:flagellar basal body P-ring formation protein FlgA
LKRSKNFSTLTLTLCLLAQVSLSTCAAQDNSTFNVARASNPVPLDRGLELATIDTNTRWAFRSLSPVTISTQIVRLGDVAQPLDPNMGGWQRLKGSPIGLLPVDGQPMTIQRDRLSTVLRDAEATPLAIDWIGPSEIQVSYQAPQPGSEGQNQFLSQAEYHQDDTSEMPSTGSLTERETSRILHWVHLAIERQLPSVHQAYEITVNPQQPGLAMLLPMAGVSEIRLLDPVAEGQVRFQMLARSVNGPIEAELTAELAKLPLYAVPRSNFPRGHLIAATDLMQIPLPTSEANSAFIADADALIGKEVRSNLMRGRPIREGDVGPQILVHRGDLVELQVLGGGVKISTNAKAVGEGAESDLIEIDTLRPRKRMVARVVQAGLVEIVTRPPNTEEATEGSGDTDESP